ncbi:MAG: hypothetical protein P1V97_04100 [Planctomycetota bacterium]|nr:hypothetical protein [Planctomycetota bacterium]
MSGKRDKIWLATDAMDQVGAFFPGRAGPIPQAVEKFFKIEELESLLPAKPLCPTSYPRLGRLDPDPERLERHVPFVHNEKLGRTVLFLRSLDPVLDELSSKEAELLISADAKVVLFHSLTRKVARDIHDLGHCLSCFWPKNWESHDGRLRARGLFRYDNLCEDWISGPYGAYQQPTAPLLLADLCDEVREAATQVRFPDIEFSSQARFQPAEKGPCHCSDFGYLDSQGEVQDPNEGSLL